MDSFDFYKDLYFKEIDRRVVLDNMIGQLFTISPIIAAILYFQYNQLIKHPLRLDSIIVILFFISLLLFIVACFFIVKFWGIPFIGFNYKYIPSTSELFEYEKQLDEYNKHINIEEDKRTLKQYLLEKFVETTNVNIKINDNRYKDLYYVKTCLSLSFVLVLSSVLFNLIKQ